MLTAPRDFILLVEDNQDDIDLALRAFDQSDLGRDVVVVKDGAEALDFLFGQGQYQSRDSSLLPELILLDLQLPKLNGLEVLKALRQHEATHLVPVVMLTTSCEQRDVLESYTRRANSYIQKPVSFKEFAEALSEVVSYWLKLNESPFKQLAGV